MQPEKPDTDSLASSLVLENFVGNLGKQVVMYCQDPVPDYIRCLDGWDRVTDEFPKQFDLTILVDAGGPQMLARTLEKYQAQLTKKPFVVIDHHAQREPMPFPTIDLIDGTAAANCEFLVKIARELEWGIDEEAADLIIAAIFADTRYLCTPHTTLHTIETLAGMVKLGGDTNRVYVRFRDAGAPDQDIIQFKGKLLSSVEFLDEGRMAVLVVSPDDLKKFGDRYDPAALVGAELQYVKGVDLVAVIREYASQIHGNKIKISFRSRHEIAADAARHFGGGGHLQAAGCTVTGKKVGAVREEVIKIGTKLIDETLQHA